MKRVEAEEQRADSSSLGPLFLLLCLLHSLSVNEAQSSQEHKHWDLSSYHRLGSSARLNTLLLFSITAPVSQSVCPSVCILSLFFPHFPSVYFSLFHCFSSHPAAWLIVLLFPFDISLFLCFSLSLSLTWGAIVVIWWSSQMRLALPVGSNLHSYVCCPHSESSERRSVLVLWPGCYQRVSTPQRGKTATQLLPCSLFSFSISVALLG